MKGLITSSNYRPFEQWRADAMILRRFDNYLKMKIDFSSFVGTKNDSFEVRLFAKMASANSLATVTCQV